MRLRFFPRSRRGRWIFLAVLLCIALWPLVRTRLLRSSPPAPDAAAMAHVPHVRILRDTFGVAHVYGDTDADAAFGMAYAHAEDNFKTIQDVFAAARGQLSLLHLSKTAIANDYYVRLIGIQAQIDAQYDAIPADVRAVLEAYAAGFDLYAYRHPREADGRLFPIRGRDVAAGFIHKLPLMVGLPDVLSSLDGKRPLHVGDPVLATSDVVNESFPGSNAHAVLGSRATDGVTRLNVNSHQPWEGPVAWYEMQVTSNEGWNMTGGTFPGAPFILHGHNDHLGWAHTVNSPDLIDVYELAPIEGRPHSYRYDGEIRDLEVSTATVSIDLGFFDFPFHKEVLRSAQGPVMDTKNGRFAIRFAGIDQGVRAVEQWFRMNKARSFDEWKAAMRLQGIPMFNTAYADRDNVFYVYNALLPKRLAGFDYRNVLPGDRSDIVFHDYLTWDELPMVTNPPSGFVQTCNSSPFQTTTGPGNPVDHYDATFGIDREMSNRALRSLALLGKPGKISPDDFERMKWDRTYDRASKMYTKVIDPLLQGPAPANADDRVALDLLRNWDGVADDTSTAAAIAILTCKDVLPEAHGDGDPVIPDPLEALHDTALFLRSGYGGMSIPLGAVQRLKHGEVDLPLGGGPDVMNAAYTKRDGGHLIGTQGDSYVLLVDFTDAGPKSRSISNYGTSSHWGSKHFSDEAPLFVQRDLKPTWRTEAEVRAHLEREYRPGEETGEP